MNLKKAVNRDHKCHKLRYGMKITNRSIFVIQEVQKKQAEEIKRLRLEKELSLVP